MPYKGEYSERRRELKAERKAQGLCIVCGEVNSAKTDTCEKCKGEHVNKLKELRKEGTCTRCKHRKAEEGRHQCAYCAGIERKRTAGNPKRHAQNKAWRQRLKKRVFAHYGDSCYCCGETDVSCLNIDHTEGGGSKQRKEVIKGGHYLYKWLIDHGFPKGYQTACFSCNIGRSFNNGVCPAHEEHAEVKLFRTRDK